MVAAAAAGVRYSGSNLGRAASTAGGAAVAVLSAGGVDVGSWRRHARFSGLGSRSTLAALRHDGGSNSSGGGGGNSRVGVHHNSGGGGGGTETFFLEAFFFLLNSHLT